MAEALDGGDDTAFVGGAEHALAHLRVQRVDGQPGHARRGDDSRERRARGRGQLRGQRSIRRRLRGGAGRGEYDGRDDDTRAEPPSDHDALPLTRTTEFAEPKSSSAVRGALGSAFTSPSTTNAYTWRPGGRRRDTIHFPVDEARWSGAATGFHLLKLPTSATRDAVGAESSNRTISRSADVFDTSVVPGRGAVPLTVELSANVRARH